MLFASDIDLFPGESSSVVSVTAEDVQHRLYQIPIEFLGKVPLVDWLWQLCIRLPDQLTDAGIVNLSINVGTVFSNRVEVSIRQ